MGGVSVLHANNSPARQQWLLRHGTRPDLIAWLVWNDPNGVWTDSDSESEGMLPLTLEDARNHMLSILTRDLPDTQFPCR